VTASCGEALPGGPYLLLGSAAHAPLDHRVTARAHPGQRPFVAVLGGGLEGFLQLLRAVHVGAVTGSDPARPLGVGRLHDDLDEEVGRLLALAGFVLPEQERFLRLPGLLILLFALAEDLHAFPSSPIGQSSTRLPLTTSYSYQ